MFRFQFTFEVRRVKSSLSAKTMPSSDRVGTKELLLRVLVLVCVMSILTGLLTGDQSLTVEITRYLFGWVIRVLEPLLSL